MKTSTARAILLVLVCATLGVLASCGDREELLARQSEELKRQVAELKHANDAMVNRIDDLQERLFAVDSPPTPFVRTASTPGPSQVPTLPVVKAQTPRSRRKAPVARVLRSDEGRKRSADIRIPGDEPPLTYQTLDAEGNVLDEDGEPEPTPPRQTPRAPATAARQELDAWQPPADIPLGAPSPYVADEDPVIRVTEPPPLPVVKASAAREPRAPSPQPTEPVATKPELVAPVHAAPPPVAPPLELPRQRTPLPAAPATAPSPIQAPAPPPAPPEPPPDIDPATLYQQSLDALHQGRHAEAATGFQAMVARFPTHGLADNAMYWLGEVDYDQQRFDQALKTFQQVLTTYPLGNKVPDAMLKIGLCFQNLGDTRQSTEILEQVEAIYPESDAARVARVRLAEGRANVEAK